MNNSMTQTSVREGSPELVSVLSFSDVDKSVARHWLPGVFPGTIGLCWTRRKPVLFWLAAWIENRAKQALMTRCTVCVCLDNVAATGGKKKINSLKDMNENIVNCIKDTLSLFLSLIGINLVQTLFFCSHISSKSTTLSVPLVHHSTVDFVKSHWLKPGSLTGWSDSLSSSFWDRIDMETFCPFCQNFIHQHFKDILSAASTMRHMKVCSKICTKLYLFNLHQMTFPEALSLSDVFLN